MLNNIKAAIFDLDGTLVDSMWIWEQIDLDYLTQIGHIDDVDFKQLKADINHLSFRGTAEYFKNRFNIKESIDEICDIWHQMAYDNYKNKVHLKEGAKEFLTELKNSGIKIGLATSNSFELLEVCLKANGVYDLFDAVTITGEVERGKNFPDVYLLAADRLGVVPEDCMVFEDIPTAVQGAKKANMQVTAIYDKASANHQDELKKVADNYIMSYKELLINN
ncbi:HAD family hydrolase [Clostridium mediterraneense]|uniref:HAD family hydrolase n=1 Tax=Clostridium mediterraneense TaxID=1805472 RepID=UPI00082D3427|nr:HAD family phosphatase [Clostridium mediterraneense]